MPELPQRLAQARVVGDALGNDIAGPLERLLHGGYAFFGIQEACGGLFRRGAVPRLGEQQLGQRLQPLFPCDGGPGAPLGLVGAVQVLHLRQGGGGVDGGGQLRGQPALPLDGVFDLAAPCVQIAQIMQPVGQGAQGGVVHGAVKFLAVAGDKGDGIALVDEGDDVLYVRLAPAQFPGQNRYDSFHWDAPSA